jgi:hypothetical protein
MPTHARPLATLLFWVALIANTPAAIPFDAAPFARWLPETNGVYWEDPREVHRVVVHFKSPPPAQLGLEYWGSRWPQQQVPKDKPTGSGSAGWMELGNWHRGGWRAADCDTQITGNTATFTFRPVNAKEAPKLKDYPAPFRYTLKLRVVPVDTMPQIERIEAFTDSTVEDRFAAVSFSANETATFSAFNGAVTEVRKTNGRHELTVSSAANRDPNTFDRTLVTVSNARVHFTFAIDDLEQGRLFLPDLGAAVLPKGDAESFETLSKLRATGRLGKTLYDRVAAMPEQTWTKAWEGMPDKLNPIYLPMGWDGGRQRFRVHGDGRLQFRSNDDYLKRRPGKETGRLRLEAPNRTLRFNLPGTPTDRDISEASIPICRTAWDDRGVRVEQITFVTPIEGMPDVIPASDATAVCMAQFTFHNPSNQPVEARFRMKYDDTPVPLRVDAEGFVWITTNCHGQIAISGTPTLKEDTLLWNWNLTPGQTTTALVKFAYVMINDDAERAALARLDFNREREAVTKSWRSRLDQSAKLVTPEPMLNELYRAFAGHQLINCEREPGAARRFARVGSFGYGAYGNESCMMVIDLERRGYHAEAQECLDAWLHYQGTAALPGDFSTKEGILYGAGGYEAGGYNQHHGWILWAMGEHFRYTRDTNWLRRSAPGILQAANWIITESARTRSRDDLSRGLLPRGTLEDIGDWWTWLSTSCYTWRGLDNAAWAFEQIRHPEAARLRREADTYHATMIAAFTAAARRSPVVRLRDGTAVPHIPSYVERRGRSFGWICETLEGVIHLLISGAIPPNSPEAAWILKDYEDNLYLSASYGYTLDDFDRYWFGRGGMSMQACLLLGVEPYLYRDDIKHALRATFNGIAVSYFPDVRMNTEHALPKMGDWAGDHYKSSDEANATGWLRQMFVREDGDALLYGQAVPRDWLTDGKQCGIQRTATYFGLSGINYTAEADRIVADVHGPTRNPPRTLRVRFRAPGERPIARVTVDGEPWSMFKDDWVELPGNVGRVKVVASY